MSLPAIAIIVSCASALFTATNAVVSYLNYRRTKPLIAVEILTVGKHYDGDGRLYSTLEVGVRLVNRSPSTATVERLVMKGKIKSFQRHKLRRLRTMGVHRIGEPLTLEPMAGIKHDLRFQVPEMRLGYADARRVRVYAELSTGRIVKSSGMPFALLESLNNLRREDSLQGARESRMPLND
ncbi:hypothetical protein [Streptomyces apricus]|uniref:Uncharacterized protein n=1 Tax=Streptomyces apricus TaxID=1828112 RepID=A0A5B0APG7_9ACTN|nr:hypothetical protein [Streptomyces apricus]KAA0930445.1 hypothetical protein FGF04_28105 [Streptomyces apricus]